jgi:hypothetical protein
MGHGWLARRTELDIRMVEIRLAGQELPTELKSEPPSPSAERRLRRELGVPISLGEEDRRAV